MVTFSGTVQSDFLKILPSKLDNKQKLINFAASDFDSLTADLVKYVKL